MKFILNLLLFISLFFNNILLASSSTIQSGIYGTI
ncbi:putative filamentous haemagglutinin, intein-containing protein [Campylobacter ureolyticus]|nr:putative filamentous haemagglutinin, intein-containing protein [Campylobacter ureolyticus]